MVETWLLVLLYTLIAFPVIFLLFGVAWTFVANREEMSGDFERRMQEEINNTIPYESIEEAKKDIESDTLKPVIAYGLYFLISIPVLVKIFGSIQYGPNLPYSVFLAMVGIPFLVCFCHILIKVDHKRTRMRASNFSGKSDKQSIVDWIVVIPVLYVLLIIAVLGVSNTLIG